jgi:hypothetical protein
MGVADLTGSTTTLAPPFPALSRGRLDTLQVNLGSRCNQSCSHCHVNAGPSRTERMDEHTLALIPAVLTARQIGTLDLTGGAPELHTGFRGLVRAARDLAVANVEALDPLVTADAPLVGLAEIRFVPSPPPDTVLALFQPDGAARGLTAQDEALLKSLYRLPLDRQGRYHRGWLVKDVGKSMGGGE